MENIRILCKCCNKEVYKSGSCGCPNMATIRNDNVSALDMSQVVLLNQITRKNPSSVFSPLELADQEARRKRGVRRLDYEVR